MNSSIDVAEYRRQALTDTGFMAREVLGYNYDEDEGGQHVNVGNGGILRTGKHQEIIECLDDRATQFKLILAPRESRKSTIAQAFCVRQISLNPNIRICYIGRTDPIVNQKSLAVRAQLEKLERIADESGRPMFGPQKGPKWSETEFTVAGRTQHGLQNATFTAFSMDSPPTGGRFNIVLLDDFINESNVTTTIQNRKSKDAYALLQPLMARGAIIVVLGTIYADDDLYADLQANQLFAPPHGRQVVCGSGVRIITTPDGKLDLEELPTGLTFQHLTLEYLRQKLWGMSREGKADHFCRQYLNEATSATSSQFRRSYFRSLPWGEDMQQLSGYLLTDTAISEEPGSCYSVCAYVGLDASDNVYLLDLAVGHWATNEYCNQFFAMLENWQGRVNHCGEAWEGVALAMAYRDAILKDSRSRKTRLHTIEMPRPPTSQKMGRIARMQPVMAANHFFVVNTVPRTFTDLDGDRELWNDRGFWNARVKQFEPSGELVDEFIKQNAKRDIADAIAMILEYQKTKMGYKRFCTFRPWNPRSSAQSLTEQRAARYRREQYHPSGSDWWEQTLHEQGF